MPIRPNLAAISSLGSASFSDSVYRVVPEALRDKILSTEGNRYYPGRYHIAGETGILYTSLERDLAARELGRHAARANMQEGLAAGSVHSLGAYRRRFGRRFSGFGFLFEYKIRRKYRKETDSPGSFFAGGYCGRCHHFFCFGSFLHNIGYCNSRDCLRCFYCKYSRRIELAAVLLLC